MSYYFVNKYCVGYLETFLTVSKSHLHPPLALTWAVTLRSFMGVSLLSTCKHQLIPHVFISTICYLLTESLLTNCALVGVKVLTLHCVPPGRVLDQHTAEVSESSVPSHFHGSICPLIITQMEVVPWNSVADFFSAHWQYTHHSDDIMRLLKVFLF